jgi:elongation factor P hydroxylase
MAIFRGEGAISDTRGAAPSSKWCAVNAIAEYADFGRPYTRGSNQVQRSFEDTQLKQRGFELLLEAATAAAGSSWSRTPAEESVTAEPAGLN